MGIFGFGNSQPKNAFTFAGNNKPLTPKQFGNFAVQWSIDLSAETVNAICKSDCTSDDATGPREVAAQI